MPWKGTKLVIGDGPELPRLKVQFPDTVYAGFRFGEDLARHLAAADVFVFPSLTDTFGLVNLEAMACGVPVAAYPVTGPIDVVEDGVTGALDEDLARAATRALAIDPQKCRERALRSGWESCSREFESNLVQCHGRATRESETRLELHAPDLWLVEEAGQVVEVDTTDRNFLVRDVAPEDGSLVFATAPVVAHAQSALEQ